MSESSDIRNYKWSELSNINNNSVFVDCGHITFCVEDFSLFNLNENDVKAMTNHFNLFDDYVSIDKTKALIEEKQQYLDSNLIDDHEIDSVQYFIEDLKRLIEKGGK